MEALLAIAVGALIVLAIILFFFILLSLQGRNFITGILEWLMWWR